MHSDAESLFHTEMSLAAASLEPDLSVIERGIIMLTQKSIVFHGDAARNQAEAEYSWKGLRDPSSMSDVLVPGAAMSERQRYTGARERLIRLMRTGQDIVPTAVDLHDWQQWTAEDYLQLGFSISPAVLNDQTRVQRSQLSGMCYLHAAILCLHYHLCLQVSKSEKEESLKRQESKEGERERETREKTRERELECERKSEQERTAADTLTLPLLSLSLRPVFPVFSFLFFLFTR